jgi:DNA-binding PadR family transcriptional regulator
MSGQQLKGHLDALLMATLEAGPAHGYAIIESLRSSSGGVFDLPEGTIYPALHRLEDAGLVKSNREVVDGRQRRIYRLAPAGHRSLAQRRTSWREFSAAVTHILAVHPA